MKMIRWFLPGAIALLLCLSPGAFAQEKAKTYANTPEEIVPFKQFKKPYRLFFDKPQPFRGPGRDNPEPAGLDVVKIGFLGPLKNGPETAQGLQMLQGAMLAVEEANRAGGYRGRPFQLVSRNDTGLWGASSNEFVKLYEEKVWGVLGSIDGASSHVALRAALKLEMPLVNTAGTDPTLTETAIPWLIRCIADDRQNSYALAVYIYKVKGLRRVAVIRNNNRYGRTGILEFDDASRRLGHPLLLELRYAGTDTVFTSQLERIKNSPAEAIVIWENSPAQAGRIVRQMRDLGLTLPVFGADRLVSPAFLESAGPAAEGVVATSPYNPDSRDPIARTFRERYAQRFKQEPDAFAAHAYDGMNILLRAIRTAGLNRPRIRDALAAVKRYHGVTGDILFDASHNDVGAIWLAEVREGTFRFFTSPLQGR